MQQRPPGPPSDPTLLPVLASSCVSAALSVPHLEIPDGAEVKVTPWESLAHPAPWPPCPARPSSGGCLKVTVISGNATLLRAHSPESPRDRPYGCPLSQRPWWCLFLPPGAGAGPLPLLPPSPGASYRVSSGAEWWGKGPFPARPSLATRISVSFYNFPNARPVLCHECVSPNSRGAGHFP